MKKVRKYILILVIVALLSACNNTVLEAEPSSTIMTVEGMNQIWLDLLNEDFGTDYKSFEQALNEQIKIYENENGIDNLYKICVVLNRIGNHPAHYDMIIQYYGRLLDNMALDKAAYEHINELFENGMWSFMEDYLTALYESNKKDRFRYVIDNLELYISDHLEIIKTAVMAVVILDNNQASDDDYRLLLNVLLECEQNYGEKVYTSYQSVLAKQIWACADSLGEAELAEKYKQKCLELD